MLDVGINVHARRCRARQHPLHLVGRAILPLPRGQ
jgi:hypothetical protein